MAVAPCFLPASKRIRLLLSQLTPAEVLSVSARELAARCGCSVRHFHRLYQQCFGVALRAQQTELRLSKARQLLAETTASVRVVAVVPVTNLAVIATNLPVRDYYLFTELTPPPDFSLAPGESLVLVVDGVRHAFAPTSLPGWFNPRKGFLTTFYRVPPELLVAIANAQEVRLRLRGVSSTIDRKLSSPSRRAFRKFLLRYFTPEPALDPPQPEPEAHVAAGPPRS